MRLSVALVDVSRVKAAAPKALDAALGVVAENVLADCTPYIPYETGALKASGQASARNGVGEVAWGTDADTARYARVQYYGVGLNHDTNANAAMAPKAQAHWFDAADRERRTAWAKMFEQEYGRRC